MHLWDPRTKLADRRQQVKNASLLRQCPTRVPLDSPEEVSRQKTRSKEGCLLTQAMQVPLDSRYATDPEKQDGNTDACLLRQCLTHAPLDSPDEVSRQRTRSREGCLLTQAMQVPLDSRYETDPEKQDGNTDDCLLRQCRTHAPLGSADEVSRQKTTSKEC